LLQTLNIATVYLKKDHFCSAFHAHFTTRREFHHHYMIEEDLNDQFASLSVVEANLSADPRANKVPSSSRPTSPSASNDALSTGSEGSHGSVFAMIQ
jgi:hypothetical protein